MRMRYWWSDNWPFVAIGVAVVAVMALMLVVSAQEQREWDEFSSWHHCKIVGQMDGHTSTGIGPSMGGNGGVAVVVISEPGKTGWLCDDGVTYWRNK